jgi:hypothetical protein
VLCGSSFLKRTLVLVLALLNLFRGSEGGGLSLTISNFKPSSPVPKSGAIPCTYYTLPNARDCMGTKFSNKLK